MILRKLFFITLCALYLAASPFSPAFAEDGETVTVTGRALIIDGRIDIARERAQKDALRAALEQVMGVLVESSTVMKNFKLISDNIYSKTAGYIETFQVVGEKKVDEELELTITATVKTRSLKSDLGAIGVLLKQAGMPRTLLVIAEQNTTGMVTETAETVIGGILKEKSFPMLDKRTLLAGEDFSVIARMIQNPTYHGPLLEKAAKGAAEIVVLGTGVMLAGDGLSGTSIKSCRADLNISVLDAGNGQELFSTRENAVSAHINEITGCTKAMTTASEKAAETIFAQLVKTWSKQVTGVRTIKLIIQGVRYGEVGHFRDMLKERVKGIAEVYDRGFANGTATFDVEGDFSGREVAEDLDGVPFLSKKVFILAATAGTITIEVAEPEQ